MRANSIDVSSLLPDTPLGTGGEFTQTEQRKQEDNTFLPLENYGSNFSDNNGEYVPKREEFITQSENQETENEIISDSNDSFGTRDSFISEQNSDSRAYDESPAVFNIQNSRKEELVETVTEKRTRDERYIFEDISLDYVIPVQSTDYVGLETADPRLVDRIWRLNNLYHVLDESGSLVKFKLRPAQEKLLRGLHWKNIILKARQLGFTTFICIFLLDYALFNRNKMVGILAQTQPDATMIFRKVKVAWDHFDVKLKEFLHLEAVGDSKSEYEFTNGSVMRVATSLRSGTYQAVLITEYGKICARFPDKAEEIKTGTLPAANKGLVFIESTAEGEGGNYYDLVQESREMKRNRSPLTIKDFKFFFFPWYQNPANQVFSDVPLPIDNVTNAYLDKIEREVLKQSLPQSYRNWYYLEQKVQKEKMKQEHPSTPDEAFLSTGNKLFNAEALDMQRQRFVHEPLETQGDLLIYEYYLKGHVYGLGADVSLGVRLDSSTICVIDFTTGRIVATFKSRTIDPVTFAYEIKKVALMYGGCLAAPEANNVGIATCVTLNQIYPNIFLQVREGMVEDHPTQKLGWLTSGGNKPKMMYELADAFATGDLQCPDEGILLEARLFNKEDSLASNMTDSTTRHFDKLMATAIAWQMRIHASKGIVDPARDAQIQARREVRTTRVKSGYR